MTGGGVLLASGVAAGGYLVGGFAGAASNVASGVREVKAANRMEKHRQSMIAIEAQANRESPAKAEDAQDDVTATKHRSSTASSSAPSPSMRSPAVVAVAPTA